MRPNIFRLDSAPKTININVHIVVDIKAIETSVGHKWEASKEL